MSERVHYLSCAPESYDSTAIYGVFDTWPEARDAAMNAEYVSTSSEIQEWVGGELLRTWQRWGNEWRTGYGDDDEVRY
ncbi:hypothetical protein [Curtobacterium sp. MCSS17_015]|uniref:hypothetical protein n=1 Tax=Curtobacterium sp. MCSS17_015 TaxID=2175666 RepID=UPI0011B69B98|nr:hypothetical protein [Curtobacterium sp. MCSS17_015]WIB25865.1 hypothetical protein DEJ18_12515 [Curtobacterium sp. MCSS17_015]